MRKFFWPLFTGFIFVMYSSVGFSQIKVLEAERSDSTKYANTDQQDSVYIVYKGENNKSTITLFASLNDVDSLNYRWFKYNPVARNFEALASFDSVKSSTVAYDDPTQNMNNYEGGYRVNIYNSKKGIDTTFTAWIWYQDFFINSISIYNSTCSELELHTDTSFQNIFTYYDLSESGNPKLTLNDEAIFEWSTDPESGLTYGASPRFEAPVEETTYKIKGTDTYGYSRQSSLTVDQDVFDSKGYPYLRAVKAEFSGIHGIESASNKPSKDTAVQVEAPYGVWFFNNSKNAEEFEWVFYNHQDWRVNPWDTVLATSSSFEPSDSIYYKRPARNLSSPRGYDVKLSVWGPKYDDDGDQCVDTIRKVEFVVVDSTQFPRKLEELPNVFVPNSGGDNDYFYFMKKGDGKPVKSIQAFSIKIYNSWGNKIYEYQDNDGSWHERGKDKPGWDGTTRVGTTAKPGVYYYTILAKGWNNEDFKVGGFFHIFYPAQ